MRQRGLPPVRSATLTATNSPFEIHAKTFSGAMVNSRAISGGDCQVASVGKSLIAPPDRRGDVTVLDSFSRQRCAKQDHQGLALCVNFVETPSNVVRTRQLAN
jgi:hypothetical protein